MRSKLLIAGLALLLIAAGEPRQPNGKPYMGGPDNFGEANRQTMAAQVVDPAPVYDTLVPETSGHHAAEAINRYRTDKVKPPQREKTTESVGGGK